MYVYFVQAGEGGPIKIGIGADPDERLHAMQIGNHAELFLLAAIPGTAAMERELHERFAAGRIRGEWFEASTPGLRAEIVRATHLEAALVDAAGLCEQCRSAPIAPSRRTTCGPACALERKRSKTAAWKRERGRA